MIKDIKYNGYTAQPSDYECPDGALALSLNLINEDNQLKGIAIPQGILQLQQSEKVLFIHNVLGSQKNYILARINDDDTFDMYWLTKAADTSEPQNTQQARFIASFNKLCDITAIGNTLAMALVDGLKYLLWIDGDYRLLGSKPPFISIDFGMRQMGTLNDSDSFDIPARCAPGWDYRRTDLENSDLSIISQMAFGLLNKAVADTVTTKGLFYQPMFVRYAYRLYDGTYSWHSAPILLLPTIIPPIIRYNDKGTNTPDGTVEATLTLDVPFFAITYRILTDGLDQLALWSDIIAGIDVFISAPIYTYEPGKDLSWRPITSTRSLLLNISPDYRHNDDPRGGAVVPDQVFVGHYAAMGTDRYIDHYMETSTIDNPSYGNIVNIPPHPKFYQNIADEHLFYKISEFDIRDIKVMSELSVLKIEEGDLTSLNSRPRLEDDFRSHCIMLPSSLYAFNSRLNLSGVRIKPAEPFPIRSVMQFGNPDGLSPSTVRITVWSRINGVRCFAIHTGEASIEADHWYNPLMNFPRYIFYPDSTAYKMEIFVSNSQKYIINLTPHDFLNGAYYFQGKQGMAVDTLPTNVEAETHECKDSVSQVSKVYTSDVNNPFVFPALGINTVGSGEVLRVCSAAKALSQGQFGQHPLYAFTSEGIWALETNEKGSYSACQPISRDVILANTAPLQMDSAVLFATDRGIMLISGSQTQCISDAINANEPFDVLQLPGMATLHSMLGHHADSCLPTAPFLKFITECGMLYDYVHQRVIVYNPHYTYAYVYSLKSKEWGMMYSTIEAGINSYPQALAVDHDGTLLNFSSMDGEPTKGLLVTRPLKLEMPDVLKTMDTVIQRGHFLKGHVRSVLYGSRDLFNWHLVWSSKDHYLRGFRGTPYKYFRIACVTSLSDDDSIFGASLQFNPRQTNQPR